MPTAQWTFRPEGWLPNTFYKAFNLFVNAGALYLVITDHTSGATFDPAVLRQLHVIGFRPDIAQARAWYEKAAGYGSVEATQRLAALPHLER